MERNKNDMIKNDIYIYMKKKEKEDYPLLDLCYYHQGSWSMHIIFVYGLALLLA
jgi:hypothetical protein